MKQVIDKSLRPNLEFISFGAEGNIYRFEENLAVKLYYKKFLSNKKYIQNKIKKIELLSKINNPKFAFPKYFAHNEEGNVIGFFMKYIEFSEDFEIILKKCDLKNKISYLIEVENLMKFAHINGILLGDIAGRNFLIDKNNTINAIDTDNYGIDIYPIDIFNKFGELYKNMINTEIDENIDKFVYTLFVLQILTKQSFSNIIFYNSPETIFYVILPRFIKNLNINKELKEVFLGLISNSKEKVYLGEYLKLLQNEEELYIKRNK